MRWKTLGIVCVLLGLLLPYAAQSQSINDLWKQSFQDCSGTPCIQVENASSSGRWTGPQSLNDLFRQAFQTCDDGFGHNVPCLLVTGAGGGGSGTVTSITGGTCISGGTITSTGTFSVTADCIGPTQIDETANYTWSGTNAFTGALNLPHSTSVPGTCSVGQVYMDTDATSGLRLYLCEATNTWVVQGSAGTVTGSGTTNTIAKFTGASAVGNSSITDNGTIVDIANRVFTDTYNVTNPTSGVIAAQIIHNATINDGTNQTLRTLDITTTIDGSNIGPDSSLRSVFINPIYNNSEDHLSSGRGLVIELDNLSSKNITTGVWLNLTSPGGTGHFPTVTGLEIEDLGLSSNVVYGIRVAPQTGTISYGLYNEAKTYLGDISEITTTISTTNTPALNITSTFTPGSVGLSQKSLSVDLTGTGSDAIAVLYSFSSEVTNSVTAAVTDMESGAFYSTNLSASPVTYLGGLVAYSDHSGTGTVTKSWALYGNVTSYSSGTIVDAAGVWIDAPYQVGTITNYYGFYHDNAIGQATNPYFLWYDGGVGSDCNSGGVYRVNSLGIAALYNPCFAKYTPGAKAYERVVQQWNNNTLEYGLENGPTQTLTSVTSVSTTATATLAGHGYRTGDSVTIAGADQAPYNGTYTVTVTSSSVFTYTFAGSGTSPATGTITAQSGTLRSLRLLNAGLQINTSATVVAGEVALPKITASGSASGAGTAKVEWVAGTNSGTCKLISYAGTSTTPVTIIDNVGGGC